MADADPQLTTSIILYCNEKYYRHMQNLAREGLQKYYNDPVLLFFKSYGILMEDRVQEAIRELESIREDPNVSLCAPMLLIYAHKKSGTFDREEVSELESKLKEKRRSAGPKALYYAGLLLWLIGRGDKAQEYIDRMLKMSKSNEGLVLKGWLLLFPGPSLAKCVKYFEEGIQSNKDLLGLIGKAECFMMQKNYSEALDIINQIIVNFPNFLIALTLKMRYVLAQQDWDQCLEIAQRILSIDGHNIDALQMLAIYSLTREGNLPKTLTYVKDLINALEMMEPRNPVLHFQKFRVICNLCGRNQSILQEITGFCERTYRRSPEHAELAADLGKLYMYQGNASEAADWYSATMKLDVNHVEALIGIIWCQILLNNLEEAEQQLEFLREVQQSLGRSKELCYVEAIFASKKEKEESIILKYLKDSLDLHFATLTSLPLGVEYLEKLDPTFIVDVVKEYLQFCPKQPISPGQTISPVLEKAATILSPVIAVAPCLPQPLYYKSQVIYLAGNFDGAQGTLQRCIELNLEWADAHLLMAQIHLSQEQYSECSLSLETGVSHNFRVREHPLYHLIKGKILEKTGNRAEAIQMLKMAMSLPEMKRGANVKSKSGLSISDQVSIYLELAKLLRLNGEQHESTKIIQDAINAFHGTPEEIRIIVANADMTLSKGDAESALNMLRDITPDQPYYIEVKQKMAEIYLKNRKDKRLYIASYRELSEKLPGPQTSLLLGDAYMNIQEPEKALEVYDQAQRKKPKDATLASRVGLSLMRTHQYKKAVNYYEAALKMSAEQFLCCDLADLFLKLKNYDKAETLLKHALDHKPVSDLPSMIYDVKFLILLGRTYKNFKTEELVDTLNKALDIQMRILKRVPFEQPDIITSQLQIASKICIQLAEHYLSEKDYTNALKYYKDAISYYDTDNKVMLQLSRLFLIMDDLDACEMQCNVLLQDPRYKDEATMMMADIMFQKQQYDKAIEHFHRVLEKTPDNFTVLNKLIDLLRRSGKLDDASRFFELALTASSRTTLEPGYNYCKGLHCWHLGQPNEALKYFNKARKDSDWGERSVTNMIQICLNPDNKIIGGEVFDSLDEDDSQRKP